MAFSPAPTGVHLGGLTNACANPDRLSRWFGPVIGDFRLGRTVILGDRDNKRTTCQIVHCEAPRRLAVTWMYPGRPVDEVELRLSAGTDDDTVPHWPTPRPPTGSTE